MSNVAPRMLPPGFPLEPGERVIWQSAAGGIAGYDQWLVSLLTLAVMPVLGAPLGVLALLVAADLGSAVTVIGAAIALLAEAGIIALGVALWTVPRARPTFFFTDRKLVSRGLFGGYSSIPLSRVRGAQRHVAVYRSRYGVHEVVTDRARLTLASGSAYFGPSPEIDHVLELIEYGVLADWLDLKALPTVTGEPAPAETSTDFFVCLRTRTDGDEYGPLFVGPTRIVRITEVLPAELSGRLYTRLASAIDGEVAEAYLRETLASPRTGHYVELPRGGTRFESDGAVVVIRHADRTLRVRLASADAERLRPHAERIVEAPPAAPVATPEPAPLVITEQAFAAVEAPALVEPERPSIAPTEGRTLDITTLSPSLRAELTGALRGGRVVLAAPDRLRSRERLAIGASALGLLGALAIATIRFAMPCSPAQEAVWIAGYTVGALPLAYLVVAALLALLAARSLPFAPGVYVLDRDVVIARGRHVRVVPLTQIAAVGAGARLPLSSVADVTLWIEGEPAETCAVPASEQEAIVERVEKARVEAQSPPSDPRRARDALGELRRSDAFQRAPRERPTRALGRALALAVPMAIVLAALTWMVRNIASDALALASAAGDPDALACYADAGGNDADRVRRVDLPHAAFERAMQSGDPTALGEYVEAYPDGPDTPAARERWVSAEYERAQGDVWSLQAVLARFPDAPQAAAARAALPALALASARGAGDVGSFTQVIHAHGDTPEGMEARRLRHERYRIALDAVVAREGRPETTVFLRALLAYLEEHDAPDVLVRFRTPSSDSLAEFDRLVRAEGGQAIEPIAPSFRRRLSEQREVLFYDRLRMAFEEVLPHDVLPLTRGVGLPEPWSEARLTEHLMGFAEEEREAERARIAEREDDAIEYPEIRIDYRVVPTGDVYESASRGFGGVSELGADRRAFAGFRIALEVEMRIPGSTERHRFALSVAPPASVHVDGGSGAPTDRTVYEAMATAAFDELGTELTAAFLGRPTVTLGPDE